MLRDTPPPLTAMQKIQLASARQKLRIDTAKAKELEEAVDPDIKLNQFGRPIVAYADMPELEEADQTLLDIEFERLACPHWAVAKYRPGFGPKNETRKLSRDSWYFYDTGQTILRAVLKAVIDETFPDFLEKLSDETFDMGQALGGLIAYLTLEDDAKMEAAILHRTTVEKMNAKNQVELAEIRKGLEKRYKAIYERNLERDNKPV